jgi:DNA-binding response OmpR family regulator
LGASGEWTDVRPTISLIEDDVDLAAMVSAYLGHEGFGVVHHLDARSALASLEREPVDLVLLDLGLPDGSGLSVLRVLRDEHEGNIPVIIMTGRSEEADRVVGLELGADDYVVKPISQRELAARVRAVLRRARQDNTTPLLRIGGLLIDTDAREIQTGGRPIALTPREYALVVFLASAPGRAFSREQLLDHVWESSDRWQVTATVDEHVYRIRRKFAAEGVDRPRITTVRSYGYRLDP